MEIDCGETFGKSVGITMTRVSGLGPWRLKLEDDAVGV